jgi:prepilin-type processing-associated H-X9-DG protein
MTTFSAIGVLHVALLLGANEVGLPLGIPPAPEDPVMAAVAPQKCLAYVTWAGSAAPNPASSNRTEKLLAEPEVANELLALAAALLTHPAALFVADSDPPASDGGPPALVGGMIVNLGDDATRVGASIEKLLKKVPDVLVTTVKIADATCCRTPSSPKSPELTWGFFGKYFVAGVGKDQVEGILDRMKKEPPAWLTAVRTRLPVDRQSAFAFVNVKTITGKISAVNVRTITGKISASGGDKAAAVIGALGLNNVTAVAKVAGLDSDGLVIRTLLGVNGEPAGILKILRQTPLAAEDLAPLPKDALMAVALRMDLDRAWQQGLEIAAAIDPAGTKEFQQKLEQAEAQLGFKIREDLLQGLGDTWCIAYAPPAGPLPIPRVLAVARVRDAKRLAAAHAKLIALAEAALAAQAARGQAPKIVRSQQDGREVFSLQLPQPGVPFSPSWCITEKELVLAITPQVLAEYLAKGKSGGSLADVPEVAAMLTGDAPPLALVYQNTPELVRNSYPGLLMLLAMFSGQLQQYGITIDTAALPPVEVLVKHMRPSVMSLGWGKVGLQLSTRQTVPLENMTSTSPVMIALLLPAVQAAREAARRAQSVNNLKQIGLALINYHDVHQTFPPAHTTDKQGKPGLSWRVAILPFIEQEALYKQFHLDEPWDSEHNKTLIPLIPKTYVSPNYSGPPGKTNYLGIGGPRGVFSGKDGTSFAKISDGTSNTVMVVEANNASAVEWTKPEPFVPDAADPMKNFKGLRPGGFNALFCDGSVRFLSEKTAPAVLKAYWTIDGGERVELPKP